MATFPTSRNWSQYNFAEGDDDEAITKQNGQNAALIAQAQELNTFGQQITQELADNYSAVESQRQLAQTAADTATTRAGEAAQSVTAAQAAAADAEAIVYGDALGDLQAILDTINGAAA